MLMMSLTRMWLLLTCNANVHEKRYFGYENVYFMNSFYRSKYLMLIKLIHSIIFSK